MVEKEGRGHSPSFFFTEMNDFDTFLIGTDGMFPSWTSHSIAKFEYFTVLRRKFHSIKINHSRLLSPS